MRAALFALLAVGAVSALDIAPAEARDYPFCMRTRYDTDQCSYYTYQQCAATANGLGTTCFANPALAYNQQYYDEQPAPRRRHRHYRAD
ncbi:MAG: hypothetical protein JWR89_2083 [Tardiphaga sp.]|jgi:hypothetical protein|uniref:DUF3551 domain-containing protein n=1 Tax=Tardiphaga sp. TaxID=1926292 RepID=UPI00262A348B|nr:DUF3551 domain-containing protein [Tardiphaga sp.]MDB5502181.1 hypothetical protein [Tardiphaga sp.]